MEWTSVVEPSKDIIQGIEKVVLNGMGLKKLPKWLSKCINLKTFVCSSNKLTSLDNLPTTLTELVCSNNKLTSLDNLPTTLIELNCSNNKLLH